MTDDLKSVKQEMQWVRSEDVPKIWIYEGQEHSHRLVTNERQGAAIPNDAAGEGRPRRLSGASRAWSRAGP